MSADHSWRALLEIERKQRAALKPASDVAAHRAWWGVVEQIFRRMVVARPDLMPEPLPVELFYIIAEAVGHLAVGKIPESISRVAGKGRTKPVPSEKYHIRLAVTYRQAAAKGLISDKTPVETIRWAYGLHSRSTVQQWCRDYEPIDLLPEAVEKKMREAGEIYRQWNQRSPHSPASKKLNRARK